MRAVNRKTDAQTRASHVAMRGWLKARTASTSNAVAMKRPIRVNNQSLNFGSVKIESCMLNMDEARVGGR